MTKIGASSTPMSKHMPETDNDIDPVDKNEYLKYVGLLNYLAMFTRPDILYALSVCSQKCSNPTKRDLRMVIRIFRYLNETQDIGITYSPDGEITLFCYVDASHNQYPDAKGHFGMTFSLGKNDGSFYAKSQKMKLVTLSSAESESDIL